MFKILSKIQLIIILGFLFRTSSILPVENIIKEGEKENEEEGYILLEIGPMKIPEETTCLNTRTYTCNNCHKPFTTKKQIACHLKKCPTVDVQTRPRVHLKK